MKAKRGRLVIPIVLILVGVLLLVAADVWDETRTFMPIDQSLYLDRDGNQSLTLRTNFSHDYIVALKFIRRGSLDEFKCLTAADMSYSKPCASLHKFDWRWSLYDGGSLLEKGASNVFPNASMDGDRFERDIADIKLQAGRSYRLNIQKIWADKPLMDESPRIQVEVPHDVYAGEGFYFFFLMMIAIVFVLTGLVGLFRVAFPARNRAEPMAA